MLFRKLKIDFRKLKAHFRDLRIDFHKLRSEFRDLSSGDPFAIHCQQATVVKTHGCFPPMKQAIYSVVKEQHSAFA